MAQRQPVNGDGLTLRWGEVATWGSVAAAVGLTALATRVGRADRWGMLAAVAAAGLLASNYARPADAEATPMSAAERAELDRLEELLEEATGATVIPLDPGRARRPVS